MSRIFKNIVKHLATEAGVEVVRGYVIERMRLVRPADLYKAIKEGQHSLGVAETKDKNFGRKWARIIEKYSFDGQQLSREMMTAENVLEWLRVDRPDLASLIINMKAQGLEWLRQDVEQDKQFLFSDVAPPAGQKKPAITLVKQTPKTVSAESNAIVAAPTEALPLLEKGNINVDQQTEDSATKE